MSIKVFGTLKLNVKTITVDQRTEMAFWMTKESVDNKIGIKLGGNVSSSWISKPVFDQATVYFELTDDPLDINAHVLFLGDGVTLSILGTEVDTRESLLSRMKRVQNFLKKMLQHELVNEILLDINIEDDEFKTINIKLNDFCDKLIQLYKEEQNHTPSIRIIIAR